MSFLDRFKTTPKYRNPDPAVGSPASPSCPTMPSIWGVIAELAASDEDVRVRRAAIERIGAVGYLARIARTERDESLRRDLADRLVAIANAAAETRRRRGGRARRAERPEAFRDVAKSSPHDDRPDGRARARFTTSRCSPAWRGMRSTPQIALEAVARVTDQAELVAVAAKTDHKEAGITALERAAAATTSEAERRELLDGIAARAKNKSVAKRARALVQEIDDAEAAGSGARRVAEAGAASCWRGSTRSPARRPWPTRTCSSTKRPNSGAALDGAGAKTARRADAEFATRLAAARAAIEARRREEAERLRRSRTRGRAPARAFVAICERVDALRGEDTPRRDREGARRVGGHARRLGAGARRRRAPGTLRRIVPPRDRAAPEPPGARQDSHPARRAVARGRPAVDADEQAAERRARCGMARRHGRVAGARRRRPTASTRRSRERFAEAHGTRPASRRGKAGRGRTDACKQQVQRVEQLIERVTARAAAEDLTLREADRAVRDLKTAHRRAAGTCPRASSTRSPSG